MFHIVHKCVYIPVNEHFSFAKIIHPPDRCGIPRSWLNSMIITQFCHNATNNARPHVAKICTQFLETENFPILTCPAYSPELSPIEHVWDILDQRVRQHVPVPTIFCNFAQPLKFAQATINSLINSMLRRCFTLHEAIGGYTTYWLVFWSMPLPLFKLTHIFIWTVTQ